MTTIRCTTVSLAIGLLLTACAQPNEPTARQPAEASTPPQQQRPVLAPFDGTVTMSARIEGRAKPLVVGVTNLPDGTELMISLSREQSSYSAEDKATVSGGSFSAGPFSQGDADLNPGKYKVDIGTPLADFQPENVQVAFGSNGENLKGPLTGPSPIGGTVVTYSTEVSIGGNSDAVLDAAAREKAKQDLRDWYVDACEDRCRIVKSVAVKQGESFDQDACYQQCLAEIPSQ